MDELIDVVLPSVMTLLGSMLVIFLGWVSIQLNTRFKTQREEGLKVIEKLDRDALHKALATAATVAVSRGLIGENALRFMLKYVHESVPDAIRGLAPDQQILRDIATAKLSEVTTVPLAEALSKIPVLDTVTRIGTPK